ncbi:hypothetical protein ACIP98_28020 [Streptomyces sp. NPDC088354]|uniref:hypothetical protein n=1 Tax=Streptomyces sp. NPDC088354 TaxID=3365856 RepID=UPI0037FB3641
MQPPQAGGAETGTTISGPPIDATHSGARRVPVAGPDGNAFMASVPPGTDSAAVSR